MSAHSPIEIRSFATGLQRAGRSLSKEADLKMSPLPHQQRVQTKLEDEATPGQIAYHGLGSGKTFTAIASAHKLDAPLLAVVPAALRNNMKKEIQASGFKNPFMVVSYEEARRRANDPEFRAFAEKSVTAFDEAQRMGRAESARSQLAKILPAKKKLFMTATPIRNAPEEIAPMINALDPGALPEDPKAFRKKFIETREVPVGFWGRVKGVKPGKEQVPINLHDFEKAIKGKVDYHEAVDRSHFPSHSESIVEVPMSSRQQAAYNFVEGRYPALAYKIRHGLPLNKTEAKNFRSFMSGPRQVSNFPAAFNRKATDSDATKLHRMADEVEQRSKKDPNYRGVSYSAFLETGVSPLSRELERRGVPHAVFTGEQDDKQRRQIIEDYNSGKIKHLLISGAGAEGLDLKGTKLMQIAEPHWHEKQIDQVRGRAIRYKSHTHLPDNERHVEVQRFHSVPQRSLGDKLFRRKKPKRMGVDEFIHQQATAKKRISDPFLKALQTEGSKPPPVPQMSTVPATNPLMPSKPIPPDVPTNQALDEGTKFAEALYPEGEWVCFKVAERAVPDGWVERDFRLRKTFCFDSWKEASTFVAEAPEGSSVHGEDNTVEVTLQTLEPVPHASNGDFERARELNEAAAARQKQARLASEGPRVCFPHGFRVSERGAQ